MSPDAPRMAGFPTVVDPKPIGRVAPDGSFELSVYIEHNRLGRPRFTILANEDFRTSFDSPARKSCAVANPGMQHTVVTQREHCRRRGGRAFTAQERQPQ